MIDIDIIIEDTRWTEILPDAEALAREVINLAIEKLDNPNPGEASLVLSNNAEVQILNRDYRGKDKPTNVLSFASEDDSHMPDIPGMPKLYGDIIVALETLQSEAIDQQKQLKDHYRHLCLHGFLHLMGYDHIEDEEAEEMEALEAEILATAGITDPYQAVAE